MKQDEAFALRWGVLARRVLACSVLDGMPSFVATKLIKAWRSEHDLAEMEEITKECDSKMPMPDDIKEVLGI